MIQKFKESKLQSIIDNVNAAIILTDINGRISYVNQRCEEMTGYKQEEMTGRTHDEFSVAEDIPGSMERLKKIIKGELTRYRIERQWIKKDGTRFWTGVSVAPLFDEKGNIEYLSATIVDISEQKKIEAALKKSEDKLRENEKYLATLLETLKTGVLIIDADSCQVLDVNKYAAELIGTWKKKIIGRKCNDFFISCDLEKCPVTVLNRKMENTETILRTVSGSEIPVLKSVTELEKNGKKLLAECFTDIGYLKKLLEEQNIDINLSKKILAMVNSKIPRYIDLPGNMFLFCDVVSLSCKQEGGDHFFIREHSDNKFLKKARTFISIKDQSGHQVGCVLRSILTDLIHQSIIHSKKFLFLEEIISELNKSLMLSDLLKKDDFLTALDCEIDHESLMLRYVSCGHPSFFIIRGDKIFVLPDTQNRKGANPPLAVLENYQFSANEFQLKKGDKLILYTDGLLETAVPEEEFQTGNETISLEELKKVIYTHISENRKLPVQTLLDELLAYVSGLSGNKISRSGENNSKDDITLIGLEIEDKTEVIEEKWCPESIEDLQKQINRFMKKRMNEWQAKGFSKPYRLQICFEEAVVNAWAHGHKSDPGKPIYIKYRYKSDFHLEIIDQGRGFDLGKVPDPREPLHRFQESGRGIFMIHNYASRARWNPKGNHLTMAFKKEPNSMENRSIQMAEQCLNLWKT